jgi:hypothetical protein
MDKMIIYRNKGETFECQFRIDGATVEDTMVRLCLEFDTNKNLFFYGTLKSDGTCSIDVPTLKELKNQQGKLVIEAIADSTYFRLYEAEVEFKNSVEMEIIKKPITEAPKKAAIQLEQITKKPIKQPKPKHEPKKEVVEEKTTEGWEPVQVKNPYRSLPTKTETGSKLTKFEDYMKKHKSDK